MQRTTDKELSMGAAVPIVIADPADPLVTTWAFGWNAAAGPHRRVHGRSLRAAGAFRRAVVAGIERDAANSAWPAVSVPDLSPAR